MRARAARVSGRAGALVMIVRLQTACATILTGIRMTSIRFGAYGTRVAGLANATGAASADHTSAVILTKMLVARLARRILRTAIGTIPVSIEAIRAAANDRFGNVLAMRTWMTDLIAIAGSRFGLAAGTTIALPAGRTVPASIGALRIEAHHLWLLTASAVVAVGAFIQIMTIFAIA